MNWDLVAAVAMFGWFVFLAVPPWFRSRWVGGMVAVVCSVIAGDFYGVLPTVMTANYGVNHGYLILLGLAGLPYLLLFLRLVVRARGKGRSRRGR
jgi:hypothetical protein